MFHCHKIGFLLLISAVFLPYNQLFTQELDLTPPSARSSALGGAHVALADDIDVLLNNPAGLANIKTQMQVTELTLQIRGPVFDITNLIVEVAETGNDVLDVIASSSGQSLNNLKAGIFLSGPVSFAFAAQGFGFGIYNWGGMEFDLQGNIAMGSLAINTEDTLLLTGGYGYRLNLSPESKIWLDLGASLKAFARGQVQYADVALLFFRSALTSSDSFLFTSPFELKYGLSTDLGVLFHLGGWFKAGIVAKDVVGLYWTTRYQDINDFSQFSGGKDTDFDYSFLNLCAGVLFEVPGGNFPWFISGLKLMLDYGDILDFAVHPDTVTNPILHLGVGMEVEFLEVLNARVGFYQGLFSAGLGIDLSVFQLNIAMFGTELSLEPGLLPTYNVILSLKFVY